MQNYAQIIDGVVANVAIWTDDAPDGWIPIDALPERPGPGWGYGGGKFTAPPAEPVLPKRQFSFLEFMDLFTDAEQLSIAGAAMTDAPTKLWYDRAVGAQYISLDDPRVGAGLQAMVDGSVITAARRDRALQGLAPEDAA